MNRCVICGSDKKKFLFHAKDRMHGIRGAFRVVSCMDCKLMALDPIPHARTLKRYYPDGYHAHAQYNPNSPKERFSQYLYELYFKRRNDRSCIFQKIALFPLKHLLRGTIIRKGGRLLDVGCGNGAFLYKMKQAGMDVRGVELSRNGTNSARRIGIDVFQGTVEQARYPPDFFDVITLNHVFEHIATPVQTLREIRRILKRDGTLIMAIPQSKSIAAKVFGTYWASLDAPRHLFIYSPKTIRSLAKKTGFRVTDIRFISSPLQFQGSLGYVLNRKKNIPLERIGVCKSRLLHWMMFPLVYLVDVIRLGDGMEVTLRRDEDKRNAKSTQGSERRVKGRI